MKTNTSMTHYKKNIIDHEERWTRNVFTEVKIGRASCRERV